MKLHFAILKYLGKHFVRGALNSVSFGVMGDFLFDGIEEVWEELRFEKNEEELRDEIQTLVQTSTQELRNSVVELVKEIAADQKQELQDQLNGFLVQVQSMIRRSLRRPADPTGTTLQAHLVPKTAVDLLPYIPSRISTFKPGDFPPSGGDWQLEELLGFGGFGEVWKACNPNFSSSEPVALKFCLDDSAKRMLENEAEMLNLLNRVRFQGKHSGIVQLQHTYFNAQIPFLEYEYVNGGDLSGLIKEWHAESGGVKPEQAAEVILQIAEIVGFAHQLNPPIVHRDLKPANILVQRTEDGILQFKITDFGLGGIAAHQARQLSQRSSRGKVVMNSVLGAYTPLYAPPQQTTGGKPDPRDDIFALGVIWYQLLTGDLSRGRPGGDAWRNRLIKDRGIPTSHLEILSACFEEEPDDRIPNGNEFVERMNAVLERRPQKQSVAGQPVSEPQSLAEYENQFRNSNEAWSFVEKHQGKPKGQEVQYFINELTDLGIVGGGKLTRKQAETVLRDVCEAWLKEDEKKREREVWEQLQKADNPHHPVESRNAYENYLKSFPNGAHSQLAKTRLEEINKWLKAEEEIWRKTKADGSLSTYREYIQKYLIGGLQLDEARQELARLEKVEADRKRDEQLWQAACNANTVNAYKSYLNDAPLKQNSVEANKKICELENKELFSEWNRIRENPDYEKVNDFVNHCQIPNLLEEILVWIQDRSQKSSFFDYFGFGNKNRWMLLEDIIKSRIKILEISLGIQIFKEKNPNIIIKLPNFSNKVKPLEMVCISAGKFLMGSPNNEKNRSDNEGPQHWVTISKDFYLGKHPVTQAQWQAVMGSNPSYFKGKPNNPVEMVTWNDCQEFIKKLNSLGQGTFRLPTEAEWEYACRAGTTSRFYWGDDPNFTQINDYAWYDKNSNSQTHEVGQKKPNAWGLYDMSGNVWEWCQDWYGSYSSNEQTDPEGSVSGERRVYRGGSWDNSAWCCRSAYRDYGNPSSRYDYYGLRLVRTP